MIHPSTLPGNHAIAVTTEGIIEIKENDVVIVGVKCIVDSSGEPVPVNDNMKQFGKQLYSELGNNVYLLKRINLLTDETT